MFECKYKVGDKVRIRSDRGLGWNEVGKQDKWLGRIMTIREVGVFDFGYRMEEDRGENKGDGWLWDNTDIVGLVKSKTPKKPERNKFSEKVTITHDGKITTAVMHLKDKTIYATAKCNPEDEFDFAVGAKLAFERLMEKVELTKVKPTLDMGKKYQLKEWYEVEDHLGIFKSCWDKLVKEPIILTEVIREDGEIVYRINDGFIIPTDFIKGEWEEPEPDEYYNGKVVCVKSGYPWWTVGKVYEVKDGVITANDGDKYPQCGAEPYKDAEDVRHAGCAEDSGYPRHNPKNEFIPLIEDRS